MKREDQWTIQFGVTQAMLEASKAGQTGAQVEHGGTKLNHRNLVIYCNPAAGPFYKEAINKISGYEAFLLGERPPGKLIYTTIPWIAEPILPLLHEHFAAGSFGAVKLDQVKIVRKAYRQPGDPNSSWHVYLEVDEEAFNWLKGKSWMSPLGLYVAMWEHPPVMGIRGYIAPEDIRALKQRLRQEAAGDSTIVPSQETNQTNQDQNTPQEHKTTQVPSQTEISLPSDDIRARHVTGEERKQADDQDDNSELNAFTVELTSDQENELLNMNNGPSNSRISTPRPNRRERQNSGTKRSTRDSSSSPGDERTDKKGRKGSGERNRERKRTEQEPPKHPLPLGSTEQ